MKTNHPGSKILIVSKSIAFAVFLVCRVGLVAQEADSLLDLYRSYPDDTAKVNLLYEKAFSLRYKDFPSSLNLTNECCNVAEKIDDKYSIAKAANLKGLILYQAGRIKEAVITLKKALELRIEVNDSLGQAVSLVNLGNIYNDMNENAKALKCYESSLVISRRIGNERWLKGALLSVASLQVKTKSYRQAYGNFETLLSWATTSRDEEILSICYNNMGLCKLNLGDTAGAEAYYLQALDVMEMSGDELGQTDTYVNLSEVYMLKKKFSDALNCLNKSVEICKKNNYANGFINVWRTLAKYYSQLGNYKDAFLNLQKSDSLAVSNQAELKSISTDLDESVRRVEPKQEEGSFYLRNWFEICMGLLMAFIIIYVILNRNHEQEK